MTSGRRLLVLGGGGATGAYQVGQLLALLEAGVVPDAVLGCSVGSLNAAYLAAAPSVEQVRQLADWWLQGHGQQVLVPSRWGRVRGAAHGLAAGRGGVLDARPLRGLVADRVGVDRAEDLAVPLTVTTTCLDCAEARHHDRGPLADLLLASCALPGLLPPVRLPDGHRHVDGGVVCGVPLEAALAVAGPHDEVLVLDCGLAPVSGAPGSCAAFAEPVDCCALGPARTAWRPLVEDPAGPVSVALRAFTVARAVANRASLAPLLGDARVRVLPHIADAWAVGLLRELPVGPRDFRATRGLLASGHRVAVRWLATV